jgi:hypothetical protein
MKLSSVSGSSNLSSYDISVFAGAEPKKTLGGDAGVRSLLVTLQMTPFTPVLMGMKLTPNDAR